MSTVATTQRLILRPFKTEDAKDLYTLNANPNVLRYTGDKPFKSIDEATIFIQNYKQYELFGYGRWAVIHKTDNVFLGWCGLRYDEQTSQTDIGFRFFEEEWNKGYATESAKKCLELGFNTFNLKEIIGRAMKENKASIHVLKKIGLKYDKEVILGQQKAVQFIISNI